MKILSAKQTREADQHTIKNEPISSLDLMERAAKGLAGRIANSFPESASFLIFCGKGNNGGDGVALARHLCHWGHTVRITIVEHSNNASDDFSSNLDRLNDEKIEIDIIKNIQDWKDPDTEWIIVDGILGSGLSRPLEGLIAEVVQKINATPNCKIAIDIPTGLFADDNSDNDLDMILKADHTLTFQYPKLSMMHKDTAPMAGKVNVIDIRLDADFINNAPSPYHFTSFQEIKKVFEKRKKFSYKGTYGHALLIAGSKGSMGAAIMSSTAALRSGAGLLSVAVPGCGLIPLQTNLPEAMVLADANEDQITELPSMESFNAVGIGPGIGRNEATAKVLKKLLQTHSGPVVVDADGLNILSEHKDWLSFLPQGSILTPHPGEFKRLLGVEKLESDYLAQLRDFSIEHGVITVLKDSITAVAAADGQVYFLDYGSPALASPGSGDVLTGIILGLLASGYKPLKASLLGVYLQGRAGTLAGESLSLEASLARDVCNQLAHAFRELY